MPDCPSVGALAASEPTMPLGKAFQRWNRNVGRPCLVSETVHPARSPIIPCMERVSPRQVATVSVGSAAGGVIERFFGLADSFAVVKHRVAAELALGRM